MLGGAFRVGTVSGSRAQCRDIGSVHCMTAAIAREFSAGPLASGYHGPPQLTPVTALTQWHLDPFALAVAAVAVVAYLTGVRRVRRGGGTWPAFRTAAFCLGGVGLWLVATGSALAVYWPVLFYMRAGQTVLLLLGVPIFVIAGRPLSLVIAAAPRRGRRIQAALTGRAARLVTFPAITAGLLVVTPYVLYFSPWYAAGFHSLFVRELTTFVLILPGLLFFWTLLRFDPVPRAYPYLVALWVSAAEVVGDAVLGLAVIADHNLIASAYYHALARPWGPTPSFDQVLGGGVLWVVGDIIGLPFLAAMLIAMIRDDESQARVIDAELDAREARTGGSGGTDRPPIAPGGAAAEAEPAAPALWWESDPRFASRFAPVDPGERDGQGQ